MIWANLLHFGMNMWADRYVTDGRDETVKGQPYMRFDFHLWKELTEMMADAGFNMLVIDIGDAIKYDSHPEVSLKDAWPKDRFREELARLHKLGLEPIPKLNFSGTHDLWLGPYARMISSDIYYKVCADLIAEVTDLFDKPRFFHLGYDEETYDHQQEYAYVVVRQFELWWHDFLFMTEQVEKGGVRPWIWSDYVWHHADEFWQNMPKSILQSNWYYDDFVKDYQYVQAYIDLEAHGYDQIPTASNWSCPVNFQKTVEFCAERIAPERLQGFLQTPWKPTLSQYRECHIAAIDQVSKAKDWFESR